MERIVAAIKDLDVAEAEKSARMYDARFEHDRKRLTEEQAKVHSPFVYSWIALTRCA